MLRTLTIVAAVGFSLVVAPPLVRADDDEVQYGVFRTNATYLSIEQRNCWIQAMISGQTINAERIGDHLSQKDARCLMHTEIVGGRCVNQIESDNSDGC